MWDEGTESRQCPEGWERDPVGAEDGKWGAGLRVVVGVVVSASVCLTHAPIPQEGTVSILATWDDIAAFNRMHDALILLGFSERQRSELYCLLSFCMACGNGESTLESRRRLRTFR